MYQPVRVCRPSSRPMFVVAIRSLWDAFSCGPYSHPPSRSSGSGSVIVRCCCSVQQRTDKDYVGEPIKSQCVESIFLTRSKYSMFPSEVACCKPGTKQKCSCTFARNITYNPTDVLGFLWDLEKYRQDNNIICLCSVMHLTAVENNVNCILPRTSHTSPYKIQAISIASVCRTGYA